MAIDLSKPVLVVDDYNTMIRIMHNLLKTKLFEQVMHDANHRAVVIHHQNRLGQIDSHGVCARTGTPQKVAINTGGP